MKKLFVLGLFFVGLLWVLTSFGGLAISGKYDELVLNFRNDLTATQVESELKAIASQFNLKPQPNSTFSQSDRIYIVKGDAAALDRLRRSELGKFTEYIEPNYIYSLPEAQPDSDALSRLADADNLKRSGSFPNDPLYGKQWNLRAINMEAAWPRSAGNGVTVAVIDTGISQVEDFKNTKFVKGYDFVNNRENAADDNGHGTHVAGTIAESTNNNFGVAGIAYEAKLMPLKVLSSWGGGTISDIAEAIRFAADNGADVINMSLGGGGESKLMKEAIEYAYQKGVVIIAAAGNSNSNAAAYPARYPRVIGVSATDPNGEKAPYSNYGAGVDISAPGGTTKNKDGTDNKDGGILQNTIDPKTGESVFLAFQGTSMASPHVAGVAALLKATGIKQPETILNVLQKSAVKANDGGENYYGAGRLNAAAAVNLAGSAPTLIGDFFRWLRDNGYLNPRIWIDGSVVRLLPKLIMALVAYILAWWIGRFFPFRWNWSFGYGLFMGGVGLFLLKGFYIFDLPQWPFRVMGSSLPELGNAAATTSTLNPISASVLLPLALVVFLLGHREWKWFAIGSTIGVAACLGVSAAFGTEVLWLGEGLAARAFLAVNTVLCLAIAYLAMKSEIDKV